MTFFQVPSPDLSTLALGGATLRLLESYGFSADEKFLLVRATYTDDADTSYGLNYGFFIYDLQDRAYVSNLNAQIVGLDNARDVDVVSAQIVGNSSNLTTIALVQTKGSDTMRLTSMVNGQVVSSDLIAELTDIENVGIESFQLARSGRFLAVQTSNAQLSSDNQPDTNDSSDIYLFDLSTGVVTRVSYVGGSEVNEPTYLKSIFVEGNQVRIGFVTDAAFVSPSRVDTNSTNYNADAGFRSDAYVWSSSFDNDGLIGDGRFDLQSISTDGTASGYVSSDDTLQVTRAGVFYTSSSETLINADSNGEKDVYFTDSGGVVSRLNPPFVAELASGAIFLGANKNGSRAAFLTDSDEISGATGAQQLILLDTNTGDASVVSEDNGVLANDWVINGYVSASGYSVAFTSAANNLTQEPLAAASGSLFVKIDTVPIVGQVYHWRTHALLSEINLAIVDAASAPVASIDTDAFGAYSLTNLGSGESRLTATKTLVEADTNRVITSADALAALKIAVGLNPNTNQEQPVSPYQLIAADVNKDGRVTSADALATLKIAVGLVDAVPQEWLLVPESAAYWDEIDGVFTLSKSSVEWDAEGLLLDSPDTGEVNFVALLLGDVNGSWDAPDSAVLLDEAYFIALEEAGYGPLTQWGEFLEREPDAGDLSLEGKVIDGYISGAMVFLDVNFNGIKDENEPFTTSGNDGDFNLELTASELECAGYVPTVVDVPVGSIDKDAGEVTEAYQMVLPPTFGFIQSADQLNITPLTSVFWSEIEPLLKEGIGDDLTCENVKSNIASLTSFQESISVSIANIVRHYNIPADKIFADYIAEGNAELSTKAELIVKGLKKSFAKTAELRAKYPQAGYAEVNYFIFSSMDGDELYPNAWYRETAYQDGDDTFVELKKISDDLETDIRLIYQSERSGASSRTNPDLTFSLNKEIESRGGDSSDYSCNYQEKITYTEDEKSYELVNLTSYKVSSNSIDDCAFENFAESSQTRYVFWGENYSDFDSQGSQFAFDYSVAKQQLPNWTDYQANIDDLNPKALVAYVDSLPKLFCQKGLAGANSVYRSKKFLDVDVTVTINRANDGSYSETRNLSAGTQEITNYPVSENPTINSCTTIDSDNDGVEDYYDAAPLDPRISYVSAARDLDGDGVPDANDPDKDNDGFDNDEDAFPTDASERLDTDGDGIGNNSDTDDDGDGVADSSDEYPLDFRNFTDTDGDGVYDMYDAAPNDSTNSSAAIFDLDIVTDAGISESLRESGQQTIIFNKFSVQDTSWLARAVSWFAAPVIAQGEGSVLSNQTNLVNWDADGSEVGDAILTTDTFFAAEAVLSPSGNELYYLTSPTMQGALRDKQGLDGEWCQLYRVDLDKERTFTCLLEVDDAEVQPVSQSLVWRDDYQRKAMSFRADGTSVVLTSAGPRLLMLNRQLVSFDPSRLPPSGFARVVDNIVWLDDEHVAVTFSIFPEGGGGTTSYWSAFNVLSGDEIDEIEFSDFRITKNGDRFIGTNGALSWDGSQFTLAQGVSNAVIDSYGNLWQKGSVYGLEMTDADRDLTVTLGVENSSGPNIYSESGTGTRIRYRDLAFSDNWIASKYSLLSKDTVTSVESVSYSLLSSMYIDLPGDLGSFIKLNDPDLWYYLRSGDETADVTLNYEVVTATGAAEQRTFVLPLEVIQNMASIDQTIYAPSQYANGYEILGQEGRAESIAIEIPNPEAERSSFCVFNTETEAQRCAELADFSSIRTDFENIRNSPARFPDSYYVCPDQSCKAPPGVQNVIIAGDRVIAYFKDSSDNRYYKAEGNLDAFMLDGDSALIFEQVVNGAGESEIIGSSNQVKKSTNSTLSGVTTQYADKRIVVRFANRLNAYATLPNLYVASSDGDKLPLARDVVWNSQRNQATLYLASSVPLYADVEVLSDDWLFVRNSVERYALPDNLTVTVLPSDSFILDDGMEAVVTDFSPASGYVELFTELSITNNAATIDMVSQPLNADNISNLLASASSAKVPEASMPIRVIPSGQGSANMAIELYAGNDAVNDEGERYAELSFTLNWQADGVSALFSVPAQDVEGSFITSSGQEVEITIENFDEDVIGITTGGVNYPRSLNIRFMQVMNKVNSVLPTNILTNGEYTAVVSTDLSLADQDGNALTQLIVKFRIGE